ncbi:unnamed protein product [Rotaria magnacalcarata]|uniref:Uncharacterized protein n=1 Tax=Rotaria magnacalcarata TaxID=392030 RepID=A0A818YSZ8_9BILA|nr:unnamed protein product [Rotaria magnacalcarata]CAF3760879.1 unnamed protein product [Rotaria magnacalcarata]
MTFNKTLLYYIVVFLILVLTIVLYLPRKHLRYILNDVDEFSKHPTLPIWSSISAEHFHKASIATSNYNVSFIESQISLLPLSVEDAYSLRWIVITSINYPTNAIKKLSKLKGWSLVLVADTSTPKNWSHPNCVFLSIESQKKLSFETHRMIPYRNYGRKTIGYLYAIQHGAQIIYETDDDNELISSIEEQVLALNVEPTSKNAYFLPGHSQTLNSFTSNPFSHTRASDISVNDKTPTYLTMEEQITINPYQYFGQSTVWPRGYPVRLIGDETLMNISLSTVRPLIQQGLANGDPDVDAIFRLSRTNRHRRINIQFQEKPPVAVSHGLLVPFNSQNTLFHYDAFWALWIPTTTTFRVCDIWRGYFVQRLLWELEPQATLTFHSPSVFQKRNPHNYLRDFEDELQLYTQAEKLIIFLRKWSCSHGGSYLKGVRDCSEFFNKIFFLASDMAEAKFWEVKDVWLCRAFLIDMIKNGYKFDLKHVISPIKSGTAVIQTKNNTTSNSNINHEISGKQFVPTRVAVCISGQPRTLNTVVPPVLPFMTVHPRVYQDRSTWRISVVANHTTAMNIQSFLFDRLPAFDVFMYVSTREKHNREPRVNDTSICEPLRPRSSSNHLLCSVVKEVDITNPSTNLPIFNKYAYATDMRLRQGLLQQLNGLLQCNAMRKEYSRKSGIKYTHWIRLRPDDVFFESFPSIADIRFFDEITQKPIVTFASKTECCCGNEDWFGVGTKETMDAYFDRINVLEQFNSSSAWTAETFAMYALNKTVQAQLISNNPMIQVCISKPPDRKYVGEP